MSKLEFIAAIVESLAWPGVAGYAIWNFRSELTALASRALKFKYKNIEVEFQNTLETVEKKIKDIDSSDSDSEDKNEFPQLIAIRDIVEVSPRAAILESWNSVENAVVDLAKATGTNRLIVHYGLKRFPDKVLTQLTHILLAYGELNELRNKAAHGVNFSLNPELARKYIDIAQYIETEIRKAIPENK